MKSVVKGRNLETRVRDDDPDSVPNVVHVPTGGMDVVRGSDELYMIGTTEIYTCLGIVLHDAMNEVASLAHVFLREAQYRRKDVIRYVSEKIEDLLDAAVDVGASSVKAHVVHLESSMRSREQNEMVREALFAGLDNFRIPLKAVYRGSIPVDFKLDARSGRVMPYWKNI